MKEVFSMNITPVPFDKYLEEVSHLLRTDGLFLTTHNEKDNIMMIGWGGITYYWGKPIFLVPVRTSRYSWQAINNTGVFTVSVPLNKNLKKESAFCGSKSGRDYDKFRECNLTPVPGQKVNVPIIGECSLHYECKVIFKQTMEPILLDWEIKESHYKNNDYHTMFYGEIAACYTTK
jgi:flavin reductase (DIM6/NTAB) family NADH-FMN oxidoreductase RutF